MREYNKPWRYALAMFGLSIMGYMYATYGTFFYNDKMGLGMQAIALGSVFFSIWDAFNDPICGFLSDKTRTRLGRRKPWLLVSVPLFMVSAVLFFSPPGNLSAVMLAVYFTAFLMLTETANTVATVNYHSLLPELFRETDKRNTANAIRQALQLVGMIIGVSLTPLAAAAIGYQMTAVIMALLGGALVLYAVLGCKERLDFSETHPPKLMSTLKALGVNRNFWCVSISHFFYQATTGLLLAGIPFFIKYTLGESDGMTAFLTGAVFVTAIPSMLLWHRLINRFGAPRVWRIALAWLGLSIVPMFFISSLPIACLAGTLIGVGIAGVTANLDMINSILIEDDAARSGLRREASFFSVISFITRLSGLVRSGVFFLLFFFFAFESSENPGDAPGMAARFMMVVFPVVLMALSWAVSMLVRFKTMEGKTGEENHPQA